ncbi:MAG: c-type cytochrome [Sideroxydans sp.]|nr:c-type cytochrome [Sideroxydans sp.]MDD5472377.1 c-type cytochrome [Sideroxydans sp.]
MKKAWILTALCALAGCQPDVQESTVVPPAFVAKPEQQTVVSQTPVQSQTHKASAAAVPVVVQPAPEKKTGKPEVIAAPVRVVEPAKQAIVSKAEETPVALPVSKALFSEAEAMALAKKKNCFACHALDKKVVGPAWRAVAEKYRSDANAQAVLEAKVRKGGKGNWGGIAMPPQPALSREELTGLVAFVLQLK